MISDPIRFSAIFETRVSWISAALALLMRGAVFSSDNVDRASKVASVTFSQTRREGTELLSFVQQMGK
jgi:hypothetical protein